jgi:hypothetical protein
VTAVSLAPTSIVVACSGDLELGRACARCGTRRGGGGGTHGYDHGGLEWWNGSGSSELRSVAPMAAFVMLVRA